jgi:hypothetical protein
VNLTPNRLSATVDTVRAKLADLSAEDAAKLDAEMAVDWNEHFQYQEQQARAHAAGILSTDEALIVYAALGEVGAPSNGGWASGTDTATKVAVTLLMGELLTRGRCNHIGWVGLPNCPHCKKAQS